MEKNKKNCYLIDPYVESPAITFAFDWIVFTHQQAGVSKKKVSGTTSSIRSDFFFQANNYVLSIFFFFFLISLFLFFCLSRGCMQKFKQQLEGGNTEWSMTMMSEHEMAMAIWTPDYNTDDPLPRFHEGITIQDFSYPFHFPWIFSWGF